MTSLGLGTVISRNIVLHAANRIPRISSRTHRNPGFGATHIVRYVFRKAHFYWNVHYTATHDDQRDDHCFRRRQEPPRSSVC
jgi:hypothetical protein